CRRRARARAAAAAGCGWRRPARDAPSRPYRPAPAAPRCPSRPERRAPGADWAPCPHRTASSQSPLLDAVTLESEQAAQPAEKRKKRIVPALGEAAMGVPPVLRPLERAGPQAAPGAPRRVLLAAVVAVGHGPSGLDHRAVQVDASCRAAGKEPVVAVAPRAP